MAGGRENVCRNDIARCVVCRCSSAVGEGPGYAAGIHSMCLGRFREGSFEGEGICIEPIEQCRFAEYPRVWVLRGVDMSICN